MSSSSSYYNYNLLLCIFLCILLHASHARPLGVINNKLEGKSQGSEQIGDMPDTEDGSISSVETKYPSSTELFNDTKLDCNIFETRNKAKETKADTKRPRVVLQEKSLMKDSKKKNIKRSIILSDVNDQSSLVSVSWRVPHKKSIKERHPGFSLDYSPPKTHPPSHN